MTIDGMFQLSITCCFLFICISILSSLSFCTTALQLTPNNCPNTMNPFKLNTSNIGEIFVRSNICFTYVYTFYSNSIGTPWYPNVMWRLFKIKPESQTLVVVAMRKAQCICMVTINKHQIAASHTKGLQYIPRHKYIILLITRIYHIFYLYFPPAAFFLTRKTTFDLCFQYMENLQ